MRADLDATLLELDRVGAVALGRAVDLAALADRDREAALQDPFRGLLVYASSSLGATKAADEAALPEAVCPDGSPSADFIINEGEEEGESAPGTSPLDEALEPPPPLPGESGESGEVSP